MANAVIGALRVNLGLDSAQFSTGLNKAKGGLSSFANTAARVLGTFAAAATAAFSVSAMARFADDWSDLNSRLANATGSVDAASAAMDRLQEVARRSYSSIQQTTEAFLGQSTTLNALGVPMAKQLDLTETLNNALVISATRGDKARSVMDAWAKAMALGSLRGDNLNTIIANSDRLAKALADSMGINVTELRKYGAAGKITQREMLGVTSQLQVLREEGDKMAATKADGYIRLNDAIFQLVGRVDQATGASAAYAGMIIAVGDAIKSATGPIVTMASIVSGALSSAFEALGPAIEVASVALAGFAAPMILSGLKAVAVAIGTTMVGAVRALTVAMMANPLGLFIGAVSAAIAAAFYFRDEISKALGVDVVEIAKNAVNSVVGAFVGGYEAVKATWAMLPAAVGDLAISAVNGIINAIEGMIQTAIDGINNLINEAKMAALKLGQPIDIGFISPIDFGRIENQFAGAAERVGGIIKQSFSDAMAVDYAGQIGAAFTASTPGVQNFATAATEAGTALENVGGSGGRAKEALESVSSTAESALNNLQQVGQSVASTLSSGFQGLIDGSKRFSDVLRDLAKQMSSMLLNKGFQMLFSALLGGGGMGGGILGGLFGGFRAEGGPVSAGRAYIVGERGPELMVPHTSGSVISNRDLQESGRGGAVVQQTTNHFHGPIDGTMRAYINARIAQSQKQTIAAIGPLNRDNRRKDPFYYGG